MKKPTQEELELNLDPNKYSQKPFNSARFIIEKPKDLLSNEVERMKMIQNEHTEVLGHAEEPTEDERKLIREQMIKKMRGF